MKGKIILCFFILLGVSLSIYGVFLDSAKQNTSLSEPTVTPTIPKKPLISKKPIGIASIPTAEGKEGEEGQEVLGESASGEQREEGVPVLEVYDGDTVKLENGEVIRLLGINAPETGQPYSAKSTQFLKETLLNRQVQIEHDVQTKDRYGRTLAYLSSGSLFVNLEILKRGLAVIETIAPNVRYVDEFKAAQDEAKKNCRGMWEGICKANSQASGSSCVQISSIQANPPGDDNLTKNEEWIEITNSCSGGQNLTNWLIKDNSASNSYQFKQYTLPQNSLVRIHSGCGSDSLTDLYWKCPEGKYAIWNNSGDHSYLYNQEGVLVSDYEY